MGLEQNKEVAPDTGLPAPEQTATPAPVKTEGIFAKLGKLFNRATAVSPSDAMLGTNAGQVLPEAAQAASVQAAKNETPALTAPSTPVVSK